MCVRVVYLKLCQLNAPIVLLRWSQWERDAQKWGTLKFFTPVNYFYTFFATQDKESWGWTVQMTIFACFGFSRQAINSKSWQPCIIYLLHFTFTRNSWCLFFFFDVDNYTNRQVCSGNSLWFPCSSSLIGFFQRRMQFILFSSSIAVYYIGRHIGLHLVTMHPSFWPMKPALSARRGQRERTFPIFAFCSRIFLFFTIFFFWFLYFPIFPDFPPIFGKFFAVKGGTLPPFWLRHCRKQVRSFTSSLVNRVSCFAKACQDNFKTTEYNSLVDELDAG